MKDEWISVKDRLPDQMQPVLVCRDSGKVEEGYRDVGDWWKVYGTRTKRITHWMPMPEPPEGVKEKAPAEVELRQGADLKDQLQDTPDGAKSQDDKTFGQFLEALQNCDTVKVILTGAGESVFGTREIHEGIMRFGGQK